MPDYRDQNFEDVEAELSQFSVVVRQESRIDVADPGTILDQIPAPGEPFSTPITLTVAVGQVPVPDVSGLSFNDAEETLLRAGFIVEEAPVFDSSAIDGTVESQNPAPGTSNVDTVTLSVLRKPVITFLDSLADVDESTMYPETGPHKANAITYPHGVALSSSSASGIIGYDLSKRYRHLVGSIGLDDGSRSAAVVHVEISGDNRLLWNGDITFGSTTPIEIDVTGVLRLQIGISYPARESQRTSVILGDFALQGLDAEVGSTSTPTPRS